MAKVLVIDTSILCVYLELPGFERCGSDADPWDIAKVKAKIDAEAARNTSLILPFATIIETGNHISQIKRNDILTFANAFADILRASVNDENPWRAFSAQGELWSDEALLKYAEEWPEQAANKISLGDASIIEVANYFNDFAEVEIFTGDAGLRSLTPSPISARARRRNKR